mgnify:CR=1 FL=1
MSLDRLYFRFICFLWSFSRGLFYRDLADALQRKVGIRDHLERATSNARMLNDSTGQRVLRAMSFRLSSGEGTTLSEMVAGISPTSDQLLLRAVDSTSDKVAALEMTASAVEFQQRTLKTMARELAIPAVAVPIVGAICVVTSAIIKGIAQDSPPGIWEGYNGLVRTLAEFINDYALGIMAVTIAAISALIYMLPRWTGPTRLKVESWPVMSLYRDYNAAVVLSALAMMIRSGKTLRESLESLRVTAQPWLRWHISRIITSLEDNPNDYLAAFSRGLMPPSVRARLASLLDSAKSFGDALVELGAKEIHTLEARVKLSASAVNWSLTGFFTAIAVVLSIGQMTIASALSHEAEPSRIMQRAQQR